MNTIDKILNAKADTDIDKFDIEYFDVFLENLDTVLENNEYVINESIEYLAGAIF